MEKKTKDSKSTGTSLVERPQSQNLQKAESNGDITPSELLRMAVVNGAEPDRLERLMDLHIKWEANQARKAYIAAMTRFREQCPTISKDKSVSFGQTNYNFAGLASTIDKIKNLMSECGLSHSWRIHQVETFISVTCRVTHIDGHSEETTMSALPDDSGKKNAIQQIASTVSYLERYTMFAMLGLASQDMDNDGNGGGNDNGKSSQQKMIEKLITESHEKFAELNKAVLSKGSVIDFELFKDALRATYNELAPEQRKGFVWTADNIEDLVKWIDINSVIKKG